MAHAHEVPGLVGRQADSVLQEHTQVNIYSGNQSKG